MLNGVFLGAVSSSLPWLQLDTKEASVTARVNVEQERAGDPAVVIPFAASRVDLCVTPYSVRAFIRTKGEPSGPNSQVATALYSEARSGVYTDGDYAEMQDGQLLSTRHDSKERLREVVDDMRKALQRKKPVLAFSGMTGKSSLFYHTEMHVQLSKAGVEAVSVWLDRVEETML